MLAPVDTAGIDDVVAEVLRRLDHGDGRVVVQGRAAAGRSTVARKIGDDRPAVLLDVLSPNQADTVGDTLLQIMRATGSSPPPEGTLAERLAWARDALARTGRLVVVRLHEGWVDVDKPAEAEPNANEQGQDERLAFRARARSWLASLWEAGTTPPMVVVGPAPGWLTGPRVVLPKARARLVALDDGGMWGPYADAAFALHKRLRGETELSPVVVRMAVGRLALGEDLDAVVSSVCIDPTRLPPHAQRLVELTSGHPDLRRAMRRLAHVRRPLPEAGLLHAVGLSPDHPHAALVTQCLGYVTSDPTPARGVQVSEPVRRALYDRIVRPGGVPPDRAVAEADHLALAEACRQADGVEDPATAKAYAIRFWLDKVHHLGNAGEAGAEDWGRQQAKQPEQLWERARALSLARRYLQAADLYEACTRADPDDDYAWHYLAFNLDRAGQRRERARFGFEKAVSLARSNVWWNARRVTFLIGQADHSAAESSWREALAAVDPDGTRTDAWTVQHLHRHVVNAWIDAGEVRRARAAFDAIPQALLREPGVALLRQRLLDAEEAMRLGGSARPYLLLVDDRWGNPHALSGTLDDGRPLRRWYAGRVTDVDPGKVRMKVVLAASMANTPRVFAMAADRDRWAAWGGPPPEGLVGRFVELGEYGPEPTDVRVQILARELERHPDSDDVGRAWLQAWATG